MVFFLSTIISIGGFMKKSKLALILSLLCSGYFVFMLLSVLYSIKQMQDTSGDAQAVGSFVLGLVLMMILPHAILMILSLIFSWVGYGTNKTGFILTQAILTTIGIVVWFPTWYLSLPIAIFGFVTYGFMVSAKKKFEMIKTETLVSSS